MTKPAALQGDGTAVPEPTQVTQAMNDFVNQFNVFQRDVKSKLETQETKMTQLERKSNSLSRPILAAQTDVSDSHSTAFGAYVRTGDDDALRGLVIESKGLATVMNSDGGYLVDPQTSQTIQSSLKGAASIRAISNVVQVEATSYDVLVDHSDLGAGWTNETDALADTDTPKIDRISIALHELSALPKASQRLLDDSAFDIENWLAERIADKFARSESAAFVSGDGIDKPKGFLTYDSANNGSQTWGELGHLTTGVSGDFPATDAADVLVDLVYSLGAQYRANASFVMNSKTAGRVRKIKDNDGRFLWADSLAAGEPARLLGYPVLICEDMPDIADWAPAIAFGDFNKGYTIAERPDLRILRDPFSAKPHVLFYATKRVGGDVSDFAAIKLLKFAAG